MSRKSMIEIYGKRYVSPGVFGKPFGWSNQKVTAACKDGRIVGAIIDSGKWFVPVDALRPLDLEEIRMLLIAILWKKNKTDNSFEEVDQASIVGILTYLEKTQYIEPFDKQSEMFLSNVVLTEKGFKLATAGKAVPPNWLERCTTLIQTIASVITIASV